MKFKEFLLAVADRLEQTNDKAEAIRLFKVLIDECEQQILKLADETK